MLWGTEESSSYGQAYLTTLDAADVASSPSAAMAFSQENVLFNKYEIGKLLGCGAFAKVFHGRDVSTGQSVAVKIIHKSRLKNKENLMNNIIREISIMSRLRHRHIVKIFEVLATKRKIYIVMEYLKGGELFSKVSKGRFSEDLGRKYFRQLISAVSFCHQRGVYHRDLKLENMLVDENGVLKVSDFGLSALNDQVHADGLLHTLCGTPAYVAPEILAKKGYDGAKVDVWSCGVILFVLTAGYLPFNDHNLMNMYRKIYKGEFRCPKWMSSELRRFISRLLDTNPETRMTIDEIKKDPWFKHGYTTEDLDLVGALNSGEKNAFKSPDLNAFDIISFSRGLDLSGMFDEGHRSTESVDRLMAEESPEGVIGKVESAVKSTGGGARLRRKDGGYGVELEGQNGKFTGTLEIYQLSEGLVVVEVKHKAGDAEAFSQLWRDKIRSVIRGSGGPQPGVSTSFRVC